MRAGRIAWIVVLAACGAGSTSDAGHLRPTDGGPYAQCASAPPPSPLCDPGLYSACLQSFDRCSDPACAALDHERYCYVCSGARWELNFLGACLDGG